MGSECFCLPPGLTDLFREGQLYYKWWSPHGKHGPLLSSVLWCAWFLAELKLTLGIFWWMELSVTLPLPSHLLKHPQIYMEVKYKNRKEIFETSSATMRVESCKISILKWKQQVLERKKLEGWRRTRNHLDDLNLSLQPRPAQEVMCLWRWRGRNADSCTCTLKLLTQIVEHCKETPKHRIFTS